MKCEVAYCLYNRNDACICDTVRINALGMCEECILVSLEHDFLEREKERQLRNSEERWEATID